MTYGPVSLICNYDSTHLRVHAHVTGCVERDLAFSLNVHATDVFMARLH